MFRMYFVSETAQVELRTGRVLGPAEPPAGRMQRHRLGRRPIVDDVVESARQQGRAGIARHVIGCYFTQQTRLQCIWRTWQAVHARAVRD